MNIPRIEDNLKENSQREMSSESPSEGRLAMDSVIIRRDARLQTEGYQFHHLCTKNIIVTGVYKTRNYRPRLVAKWKSGDRCAPIRQSARTVESFSPV